MKRYLCLILVLAAVFLFSCSAKPDKEGAYQNFLWLNTYANPSTLNPILASDSASYAVINFVFRGLMKVNENLEIVPEMAASYTVSPDGKTYTFYLHKNITWHDGQPFTAEDVKFTFDKILDPQTKTVKRSAYIIDGQPIKFKVIDTYTIQAILPQPYAPLLTNMTAAILPKHLLEDQDINTASFNSHPVGTGPFVFKSWKNSQYITLVKNEHYYLGAPKLDGIIYKIIPNVETALLAYKKGELDIASFQPKAYAEVQKLPYTKIYQYDILYYSYLGFNLKNPL
ncbi:ABC transporter substrate-binding protein, partial [bacterium]|nr:ABC transporter substrate-binding protein [bacterium]